MSVASGSPPRLREGRRPAHDLHGGAGGNLSRACPGSPRDRTFQPHPAITKICKGSPGDGRSDSFRFLRAGAACLRSESPLCLRERGNMLRLSVLGAQQISNDRDGDGVEVRSSRALALVAYLAVDAGVPQSRQRVASLLWPESGDAQALTNLRRELHYLR